MPRKIQKPIPALLAVMPSLVMIAAISGGRIMDTAALLKDFCSAVERRDGKAFAELFTEDGVYHDVFYGAFKGRAKIAEMIDDWFHRTARDFRWEMFRPVSDGKTVDYREVANVGPGFVDMGFAPERIAKILAKEGAHLKQQPEWKRHAT